MPLFNLEEEQPDQAQVLAKGIIGYGNQVDQDILDRYKRGREMLWGRPQPFTIADAQAVIDAMGPFAIPVFQSFAALGQFINTVHPGALTEEELTTPVPYTVVNGRIVLDPEARYPTEPEPVEEEEEEGPEEEE